MNNSMINPSVVDLLKKVEDRYSLVIVTSRRARQIIDGSEAYVTVPSNKPLTPNNTFLLFIIIFNILIFNEAIINFVYSNCKWLV